MSYTETMNVEAEVEAPLAEPVIRTEDLTALDRCDQCGAQAWVHAFLPEERELMFCAHHFRKGEDKIRAIADFVKDERWRLLEAPPRTQGED